MARVSQTVVDSPDGGRIWLRPLLAMHALSFYLYKLIFPAHLAIQYHQSPAVIISKGWLCFTWIAPVAITIVIFLLRKRLPWLVAAGGLLVAGTLPVLGLTPFQFEADSLVADHYLYVAMLGPALALAFGLVWIGRPRIMLSLCSIALVLLGARSWFQTWHWRDSDTLFRHTLAVNPDSDVVYSSLATLNLDLNRPDLAIHDAKRAIDLQPNAIEPYLTLGSALRKLRRWDEALAVYQRALRIDPHDSRPLLGTAITLAENGRLGEAMVFCRRAIKSDPNSSEAHRNLGLMLFQHGDRQGGLDESAAAVRLNPSDVAAHIQYAALLAQTGNFDAAATQFRIALQLDPGNESALHGLRQMTQSRPQ